ncbi:hypothetical protein DEJ23_06345 [Curtobacterium sp. MCSS17_008]|uniref:O-antigen ligase family protein n=1 Tax=Curtobacterium sp. MCSS17_008 TaxID=2175647 RepID=UPI000DAAC6E7|nr:O-antigen ligase family protein [Curtobacterium sp. MCSS17_008]PZF57757.1 hypothetical protein DEJ23_06345 [Curtobacterium sp. MCSS17_008]
MQEAVSWLLALAGIILLASCWKLVRTNNRIGQRSGVHLAAVLLVSGGIASDTVALSGRAWLVAALIVVFAVVVCIRNLYPSGVSLVDLKPNVAAIAIMFGLWAWLFGVNVVQNYTASDGALLSRLGPGVLWLAVLLTWRRTPLTLNSLTIVALASLSAVCVALPFVDGAWRPCDQFKCGVFGGMLRGPFSSENYLAYQASFIGVAVLVTQRGWLRASGLGLVVLILFATESRTSQIAFLTACAVYFATYLARRTAPGASPVTGVQSLIRFIIPVIFGVAAVHLITTAQRNTLSNRGDIWLRAIRELSGHFTTGLGLERWEALVADATLPNHYPHSEYVLLLFFGGFVAIAGFIILVIAVLRHVPQTSAAVMAAPSLLAVFLCTGLAEVVWNPLAFDGLLWTCLALCAPIHNLPHHPDLDATGSRPIRLEQTTS